MHGRIQFGASASRLLQCLRRAPSCVMLPIFCHQNVSHSHRFVSRWDIYTVYGHQMIVLSRLHTWFSERHHLYQQRFKTKLFIQDQLIKSTTGSSWGIHVYLLVLDSCASPSFGQINIINIDPCSRSLKILKQSNLAIDNPSVKDTF